MPRFTNLGALRMLNPEEWKQKIIDAMQSSHGRVPEASKLLDVSERQLFRWLAEPVLDGIQRVPVGEPKNGKRFQPVDVTDEIPPRRRKKSA